MASSPFSHPVGLGSHPDPSSDAAGGPAATVHFDERERAFLREFLIAHWATLSGPARLDAIGNLVAGLIEKLDAGTVGLIADQESRLTRNLQADGETEGNEK